MKGGVGQIRDGLSTTKTHVYRLNGGANSSKHLATGPFSKNREVGLTFSNVF